MEIGIRCTSFTKDPEKVDLINRFEKGSFFDGLERSGQVVKKPEFHQPEESNGPIKRLVKLLRAFVATLSIILGSTLVALCISALIDPQWTANTSCQFVRIKENYFENLEFLSKFTRKIDWFVMLISDCGAIWTIYLYLGSLWIYSKGEYKCLDMTKKSFFTTLVYKCGYILVTIGINVSLYYRCLKLRVESIESLWIGTFNSSSAAMIFFLSAIVAIPFLYFHYIPLRSKISAYKKGII